MEGPVRGWKAATIALFAAVSVALPGVAQTSDTGSIAGTVTSARDGSPLKSVCVTAVNEFGAAIAEANANTDADGRYRIDGLPPGRYGVRFYSTRLTSFERPCFTTGTSPPIPHIGEYYSNRSSADGLALIEVRAGEAATGVSAALVPYGRLFGSVTIVDGTPATRDCVAAFHQSGSSRELIREELTADDGTFEIYVDRPGSYKVLVSDCSLPGDIPEVGWFGDVPRDSGDDAATVSVLIGASTGPIDVVLGGTDGPVPPAPTAPIIDDYSASVFESDILWLLRAGVTTGCNPPTGTLFCPDEGVTRGQMAAFLVRALDLIDIDPAIDFDDDDGSTFEADIERLATAGITTGCAPDSFCPDETVTRGQMAAFLARALDLTATDPDIGFDDDNGSTFEADIERLATAGITTGCAPDSFCPNETVTRGQMAAFLRRALER